MATQWSNKSSLQRPLLPVSPLGNLAAGAMVLATKRDSHCFMTGSACGLGW